MQGPRMWYQFFLASQYALQGILYGLQLRYLPIILRKSGSSLLLVGSLNLLTFPWLLKSLWAPIIDIYGNKTFWLSTSYAGTALALLLARVDDRIIFITSLVLLNLFSATVDLTLGKILLSKFHGDQLSRASSLQIIGYKIGFLIGGGLTLLAAEYSLMRKEIFFALAISYFSLMVTLFVTKSYVTPDVCPKPEILRYSETTRMSGFSRTPGLQWMIACACVYKYASHSSQSIFTMFLIDTGESLGRIGFLSGMVGQGISIAVASMWGVALSAKRILPTQLFLLTSLLSVCSVFAQLCVVWLNDTKFIALVYLMLSVVHGSQATPVYTLMLRCSQNAPPSVQTTCYSFLGTLEILGKQLSLFIAGVLTEALGYVAGLYISLVVSFFVIILVWHCPKYLRCP
ncbi:unnamed protein product [Pocillopora meandrina]|uniref:Major facilitator superfamily domain-containing protein 3 n=1 Tax=Pocillopora meandrina TaxID=46732 RepID=A0AAU9WIV8_9CNID|nr:unnamed protein product [Pocillopora meandrina]